MEFYYTEFLFLKLRTQKKFRGLSQKIRAFYGMTHREFSPFDFPTHLTTMNPRAKLATHSARPFHSAFVCGWTVRFAVFSAAHLQTAQHIISSFEIRACAQCVMAFRSRQFHVLAQHVHTIYIYACEYYYIYDGIGMVSFIHWNCARRGANHK